jgi:hypothetical protein
VDAGFAKRTCGFKSPYFAEKFSDVWAVKEPPGGGGA